MFDKSIFISIASYRDKQLVPTVIDAIRKSKNPKNLFFGINWQKDDSENISAISNLPNIRIEDYDWKESKGACWARHSIQKNLYNNESFYLQLDSHHRFIDNWDEHLFKLYDEAILLCNKPLIGTYGTTYWPQKNEPLKNEPYRINTFESFGGDGDIISRPVFIKNHKELYSNRKLIWARLLSGHFIFGSSKFIEECPYDPNFYFRGEELSLSARAYTHGYDFLHPTYTIIWHEYLRENSNKHWLDHIKTNGFIEEGEYRNKLSKQRQRKLFGMEQSDINFKQYGFGSIRSLHDYELYCGLDFKNRRVHKYAHDPREEQLEPYLMTDTEWNQGMLQKFEYIIQWDLDQIPDKYRYSTLLFSFENENNELLYRKDIKDPKYLNKISNTIEMVISCEEKPHKCIIMPYALGYGWTSPIIKIL